MQLQIYSTNDVAYARSRLYKRDHNSERKYNAVEIVSRLVLGDPSYKLCRAYVYKL